MSNTPTRLWRSPDSAFHEGDEALPADEVYDTDYLRKLSEEGFSAIWLRTILRDIVKTEVFPDLGEDVAARQESLHTVCDRAAEVDMGVWLFLQPPLALPPDDPFWDRHPEVEGATSEHSIQGDRTTKCVSVPTVREYLRQAATALSDSLSRLRGTILITASDYMQHCYDHYDSETETTGCERCDRREPKDVIGDIVGCIHDGFERADNGAEVVAWNWSWNHYYDDPQSEIIEKLPEDVTLMAGFERGGSKEILGKTRPIDEYSLSFTGPSERCRGAIETARDHGMDTMVKLQISTTLELVTVPNLPVIGTVYEKVQGMRDLGVEDFMGCWVHGNLLTANTAALIRFLDAEELPPREVALADFATDYFPGCDPVEATAAWETFADAMDFYPFSVSFLYHTPLNYVLVHPVEPGPLDGKPIGRSYLDIEDRGDELERSFGPYALDELIAGLGQLWRTWEDGVAVFEDAVESCDAPTATEELRSARVAGHCFHSGWNLYRAYRLRTDWDTSKRPALLAVARDERDHLEAILPVVEADDRMGFHSPRQVQMYTADGIRQKIADLNDLVSS